MKKFIFMILAAICSIMTVSAQSQSNYCGSSKFFDNVSIGVVGGVETNLNDWNAPQGAVAGIVLNKEISPIFGVTLEGNTNINGLRNWASDASHFHCANTFDGLSVYLTPRVNLTNALLGYKGSPRKFELEAVAGPGYGFWLHDEYNALLVKAGLNLNYNLSNAFTVTLRPAVVYNLDANNAHFDTRNAVAQLTAGIVYHFNTSNGTRSFKKAKLYSQSEVDALNAKITDLQSNLETANKAVKTNAINTVDTVYTESPSSLGNVVSFTLNSAKVDETQMANLDNAVRILKENPDLKVTLKGYADKNTGSATYNKRLSVRRAEAVKKVIVDKYGIDTDRIDVLGVGDTEQLYNDNNWNRVVIFVEKKK
jgi:outer membrane protein OmpA-like peptidoglycan-associated protein